MAIPEDHEQISTNLPVSELEHVLEALQSGTAEEIPSKTGHMLFNEHRFWFITFEGVVYKVQEWRELVTSIHLVPEQQAQA